MYYCVEGGVHIVTISTTTKKKKKQKIYFLKQIENAKTMN